MNKHCMNCAYGGSHHIVHKWCSCSNQLNQDRFKTNNEHSPMAVDENYHKKCKLFMPHIELGSKDIEVDYHYNVSHKCPYCENEDVLYDVDPEADEIIECENCGKEYKISWCLY